MKRLYTCILIAAAAFCMQSCLFEQEDVFEESSAVRLQKSISEAKAALVDSEYGWLFEIYPSGSQKYGGWAFTAKFDGSKVEVNSEISTDLTPVTSLYDVTSENGPTLIFNSYNSLLHYFSTPSSAKYQAYEGEFAFVIEDIQKDVITVRGSKTGNKMYLRKLTEPAADYLAKIPAVEDNLIMTGFDGTVDGKSVVGEVDTDYRQIKVTYGEESETLAYSIIPGGVRLYAPFKFSESASMSELLLNSDGDFVIDDGPAKGQTLKATFPEGYVKYADFAGDYILKYSKGQFPVKLTPAGDGTSYLLQGVNDNYEYVLTYSKGHGVLTLGSQLLTLGGENIKLGSFYVGLVSWDSSKGYINYGTTIGMETVWNGDSEKPVYTFKDNAVWGSYKVNSFIMYAFTAPALATANRNTTEMKNASSAYLYPFGTTTYQFVGLESITKVVE